MSGAHTRAGEVQKTTEPVCQPGRELIRRHEQGPAQAVAPQDAYRRAQRNRNGLRSTDLLALQRAVGNRGVQRMVARHVADAADEQQVETTEEDAESTVQTIPAVGAPSDLYAQGADRAVRQVMTMPEAATQRQAATQRPNRTGLPDGLKSGIESLSGMSLDNVNVHYNSAQPAQLNALAYTQGSDIHVAPGQEQHLPHEAWHVVQQAQGRVRPTMQMKDGVPVNDDEGLEREADVMGSRATEHPAQLGGTGDHHSPAARPLGTRMTPYGEKSSPRDANAVPHSGSVPDQISQQKPYAAREPNPEASEALPAQRLIDGFYLPKRKKIPKERITLKTTFEDKHVAQDDQEAEAITLRRIRSGVPAVIVNGVKPNTTATKSNWENAIDTSTAVVADEDEWQGDLAVDVTGWTGLRNNPGVNPPAVTVDTVRNAPFTVGGKMKKKGGTIEIDHVED